ncbi:hypothetical protein F2Q68_00040092 [Brassica cretica]|uniref:F-box associated beta-propeller type 1 domain-containing protein n=1 Tax=Brassica cretica TaxID=69181 RepID=A0A8S9MR35_BRACR|nr:hypothetical protein F2Q68_00040092 [Brassica cretica]
MGKVARQFILKKDDGVYSVSIGLDNSFEFTSKLTSLEDSEPAVISTIHQCDGLFLFTTKDSRLVVWNPCTSQTRWIQPSNRNYKNDRYLLGYENDNKSFQSYKILRSSEVRNEFGIYDFNSDSWRLLDGLTHIWFIRSRGVSLKGSIYWVAWDRFKPFTRKYLKFSEMKIWVMDTKIDEAKSTNIQYSLVVDFSEIWSTYMSSMVSFGNFLVDEETKKVVLCGRDGNGKNRIAIYIFGGDQNLHVCKQLHGEIAQGQYDYWQLPLLKFNFILGYA